MSNVANAKPRTAKGRRYLGSEIVFNVILTIFVLLCVLPLIHVISKSFSGRNPVLAGKIFLLPKDCPDFSGLRLVRSGLYLGALEKKRFEPSPSLALALKPEEYPRVLRLNPEDPRVLRYLRGETIEAHGQAAKGWTLVCLEEFPLGWAKCDGLRMKNKYPPGWRML